MVPLDRLIHEFGEFLAPRPLLALASRRVVELDAGLRRDVFDSAREVEVLDLLDEREDVTPLVAAEALVSATLFGDVERARLLGVERAQANPVAACAFQSHVLLNDVDDRHGASQPLDVVVLNPHPLRLRPSAIRGVLVERRTLNQIPGDSRSE